MSTEANTIRAAVAALLAAHGIIFEVRAIGERVKDKTKENPRGWTCDEWRCEFSHRERGAAEDFDFFTGIGHRKPAPMPEHVRAMSPYSIGRQNWERANPGTPVAPHPADVLHSLILDSSAVGQSFESWCDEYGYDSDSRKAEATYRECQQNADKLARVLGRPLIAELSTLLQDY